MESPASPWSIVFWNVSTPVALVNIGNFIFPPINSNGSPTLTLPCSIVPQATVPLPLILYTESIDNKNGSSIFLCGGSILSNSSNKFLTLCTPYFDWSLFKANNALPLTNLVFVGS